MLLKPTYPLPPLGGVHILGAMPTYFTKTGAIVGSKDPASAGTKRAPLLRDSSGY